MRPKALIVEDDDRIIESIEDTLFSIGHEHVWTTNQQDAREMLSQADYDYVLLDLQIPAKPNRGGAAREFGCNLLHDIQRIKGRGQIPVIVMTAYGADCLDLTTELYANGASEFIAKPFPSKGRTLASVIRQVLNHHTAPTALPVPKVGKPSSFHGGELVFYTNRAELLGVTIISDQGTGQSMAILKQLRQRDQHGRFVRLSAEQLANAIGARGGVGTVTGCVQTLRRNCTRRLGKQGIEATARDLLDHDEQGYFLRDWIVVRDADQPSSPCSVPHGDVPAGSDWNERQEWILEQLRRGDTVERVMVEREFDVAEKTAKRDLAELVRYGMIRYVRRGRMGHYRLAAESGCAVSE